MGPRCIKRFTAFLFRSFVGISLLSLAVFALVPLFINDAVGASSRYDRIESQSNATRMFDPVQLKPIPAATPSDAGFTEDIGGISVGAVAAAIPFTSPKLELVDLKSVLWSQAEVTGKSETYRELMINGKWNWEPTNAGEIVHAVRTSNGVGLIDNTRAAVALDLGKGSMRMQVHEATDLLPDSANQIGANGIRRFGNAKTWGEAFDYRVADQWKSFKQIVQSGGNTAPPMFKVLGRRAGTGSPILQGLSTDQLASSTFSIGKKGQMSLGGTLTDTSSSGTLTRNIDAVTDATRTNIAGTIGSSTLQNGGILARTMEKVNAIGSRIGGSIDGILTSLATKFPDAAASGAKFFSNLGMAAPSLSKGLALTGFGILGIVGIVYGLFELKKNGPEVVRILSEEGFAGFGTRDGVVTLLDTVSAALDVVAGGAGVVALALAWTGVGGAAFGTAALILGAVSLALKGTSAIIKNWEWITEKANATWEATKDAMAKGLRWVEGNTDAAIGFAKQAVTSFANKVSEAAVAVGAMVAPLVTDVRKTVDAVVERAREEAAALLEVARQEGIRAALELARQDAIALAAAVAQRAREEAAAAVALAKQIAEAAAEKVRQEAVALAERIRQSEIAAALERARQEAAAVAAALAERVRLAAIAAAALARQVAEAAAERARQEAAAVAAAIVAAAALAERTRQAAIAAAAALAERVRQEAIAAAAAIERARQEAVALAAAVAERARQAAAAVAAEAERVRQEVLAAAALARQVAEAAAERARQVAAAIAEGIRQAAIAAAALAERTRQAAIAAAAAIAERVRQEAAALAERIRQSEIAAALERARQAAVAAAAALAERVRQEAAAAAERVRQAAAAAAAAVAERARQAAASAAAAAQAAAARVAQAAAAARQAAAAAASRVFNFFRAPAPARSSGRRR